MTSIAVLDFEGQFNAPVAVSLDTLQIVSSLAGRPLAEVAHVVGGARTAGPRGLPWSALSRSWDVLIVPGLGLANALDPLSALATPKGQRLLDALRRHHDGGGLLAASCTATFALAEAGLLDDRHATTSWWLEAEFRRRYPRAALKGGALTTEDGRVLCAGGTLAHVDLMLVLVAKLFGAELATRTAQYLVSPWKAPQSAVAELGQTRVSDELLAKSIAHIKAHLRRPMSVAELADELGTTARTLHRRAQASLGLSVIGLMRRVRGEEAMRLLRETNLPLVRVAERVGYSEVSTLRSLVVKLSGQTPATLRRRGQARV
ncbi:MAG: helix-turn-helix domain-containing protein [Burkholderiaceae bacterium]|nr:helix-turn-helix domain-containing protein [Burkholderiaceae bacterium]